MKTSIKYIAMAGPLFLLLATGCQREVFVEGDGEVLTVRIADEAYAVANARDELKAVATAVIGSNEEDAVAAFLRSRADNPE